MTAARPLVIDTDPGVDDALAILLALASPEVDLRLVTTVHGNAELPRTTDNARRVLALAGRADVPVAAGARAPLVGARTRRAGSVHGEDGLGGVRLPPSPAPVDPRPAVVALAELLTSAGEPVTVAAIGPLTNLALLLAIYPEAAGRIDRLVVMGGSAGRGGTVTAVAEFNVWSDPEAARAVLGSSLPTVLVGLNVTLPTVVPEEGIGRVAGAGPIGATAGALLRRCADHARNAYGADGAVLHDALALAEVIAPGTVHTAPREVVVDTGPGPGRGQTLVDRRARDPRRTAVRVAESVDGAAVAGFVVDRLCRLDRS